MVAFSHRGGTPALRVSALAVSQPEPGGGAASVRSGACALAAGTPAGSGRRRHSKRGSGTGGADHVGDSASGPPQAASAPVAWGWFGHRDILIVIVWLVFLNSLPNGFHLDDYYRVVDNPGIHRVWPVWRHFVDPRTSTTAPHLVQFRPLLPLTLSINYALQGDAVSGYHAGNLIFHVVSVLLVYALCLELLTYWSGWCPDERWRGRLAFAVALIYGVHPVAGIPVNYICARDLAIMQCFLVACMLAYVRMRRLGETPRRWAWVLGALALSLMGKTNSVVAPGMVLAFDLLIAGDSPRSIKPWLRAGAVASVVVALFAYTKFALGFSDFSNVVGMPAASVWEYPLTQLKLHLFEYVRNFFWPFLIRQGPAVEPARSLFEPPVLLGAAFIVATLAAAWRLRKTAPLISWCILCYWALMVPEASVLRLHHMVAHYRAYASSPFFWLILALLAYRYLRPATVLALLAGLVVLYAGASVYLNTTWRTDETLWAYSVRYGGEPVAHLNWGMATADPQLRKQRLEEALRLAPNYIIAHIDMGLVLIKLGDTEGGLKHLQTAVSLDSRQPGSHYWLADAYRTLGKKQEAALESAEAARLDPRNLKYQLQAAIDASNIGDFAGALRHVAPVIEQEPERGEAQFIVGFARQMTGDTKGALAPYTEFLRRNPRHSQAHFNLALALIAQGQYRQAIEHLEQTLALKPDYRAVHLHLATCYEKLGDGETARKHRLQWEQRND